VCQVSQRGGGGGELLLGFSSRPHGYLNSMFTRKRVAMGMEG